ncbi:hypothetical protein HJFPF1_04899 [Paramyrothecium foliicola]|nr:hypothetical protein HJFPF1_04899 [Paramyrothecium foliicola]
MSNDDILTDDYVAGLLAQEAQDCSLKYSAMGLEAFRSNKKPSNMPKPNTRFLRHIIKDTNTHNKALLAKEAAESKARLKDLEHTEEKKRLKTNPNAKDIRRRQMGDIHAILGGSKRRRTSSDNIEANTEGESSRAPRDVSTKRSSGKQRDLFSIRAEEQRDRGRLSRTEHEASHERGSRKDEGRKSRRHRERGSASDEESRQRSSRRRRDRSRSRSGSPHRRRRRSQSPRERSRKHRHRSPVPEHRKSSKDLVASQDEDSDPLEDLIGPAPPPRYRGRGTLGGAAGIDRRFSESYDPRTDVQMDDDEAGGAGNWDDAVEAFRDRQKMKQSQEQRLQEAGFAPQQIAKMNGDKEMTDEDVRWSKSGEKREWDLGK